MKLACVTKADIGYNKSDSTWVLISEHHPDFHRLVAAGCEAREADAREAELFSDMDELHPCDFE